MLCCLLTIYLHCLKKQESVILLKKNPSLLLFLGTIFIGLFYSLLPYTGISKPSLSVIGTFWNLLFATLLGFLLLKKDFVVQFKHFSFKTLFWGIPLILIVGTFFSAIYSFLFGKPTTNSIGETIPLTMVFFSSTIYAFGRRTTKYKYSLSSSKKRSFFFEIHTYLQLSFRIMAYSSLRISSRAIIDDLDACTLSDQLYLEEIKQSLG